MSTTLHEALGLTQDDATEFTPYLIRAEVLSANADAAVLSFTHNGRRRTGVLPVTEQAPGARWEPGQKVTAVLCEPVELTGHPRLSTVRRELVTDTLAALCPEIRTGAVRVMGVARKAGVRTKVAVAATTPDIDPVAACVGRGHNRVDALRAALGGEQVDIIAWHPDKAVFLSNALQPAAITAVDINAEERTATATAPPHQMSAAVGGGGLNSALAGRLVGLLVTIVPG